MLISKHNNTQLVVKGVPDINTLVDNTKYEGGQLKHAGPFHDLPPEEVARIYKTYKSSTVTKVTNEIKRFFPRIQLLKPFYRNFPPHFTKALCLYCDVPMVEFINLKGHRCTFKEQHKICPLCKHSEIEYLNGQHEVCNCQNCCYEKTILEGEPFVASPQPTQPTQLSCYDILCLHTFLNSEKYHVKSMNSRPSLSDKYLRTDSLLLFMKRDFCNPMGDKTELQVLGHLLNNGFLRPEIKESGELKLLSTSNIAYSDGSLYFQRQGAIFTLTFNNVTITHANKLDTLKSLREQFKLLLKDDSVWSQIDLLCRFTKLANLDCKSIQLHTSMVDNFDEHLTNWEDNIDVGRLCSASLLDIESVVSNLKKYPELQNFEGIYQYWDTAPELVEANKALAKAFNRNLKRKLNKPSAPVLLSKYKQSTLLTTLKTLLLEWDISLVDFIGRDLWQDNIAPKILDFSQRTLSRYIDSELAKDLIYSGTNIELPPIQNNLVRCTSPSHTKDTAEAGVFMAESQLIDLVYNAMLYGQVFLPQELKAVPSDFTPNEKKEYLAKRFVDDNLMN
ncbi:hypothetical protein AB6D04_05005 [Vibrio splendidus]